MLFFFSFKCLFCQSDSAGKSESSTFGQGFVPLFDKFKPWNTRGRLGNGARRFANTSQKGSASLTNQSSSRGLQSALGSQAGDDPEQRAFREERGRSLQPLFTISTAAPWALSPWGSAQLVCSQHSALPRGGHCTVGSRGDKPVAVSSRQQQAAVGSSFPAAADRIRARCALHPLPAPFPFVPISHPPAALQGS